MTDQVHTTLPLPGTRMTTSEFLDLPETLTRVELIDGVVVYAFGYPNESNDMSPSPTAPHQKTARNVFRVVDNVENGEAWFAPMDIVFPDGSVVQPDIFWFSENNKIDQTGKKLAGVPDLIIEVLSPSTEEYDRDEKFRLYEKVGVSEYWILDPIAESFEIWSLFNGKYRTLGIHYKQIVSPLLNTEINVTEIFS